MKQCSWSQCCRWTGSIMHMMRFVFCECLLSTLVPSACTCVVKMQPSLWIFDIWKFHRIFQTEAKRLTIRIFDIPSHYAWNSSTNATILHKVLQYIYTTHYTLHTNITNHGSKLQDNWKQQCTEMYTSTWEVQTEIPQKERHQDKEIVYTFMA